MGPWTTTHLEWATAHIIRNDDVALTECGLMLYAAPALDNTTGVPVLGDSGSVALWDDTITPPGHMICADCMRAYG